VQARRGPADVPFLGHRDEIEKRTSIQ
jgi:hypothetical protein